MDLNLSDIHQTHRVNDQQQHSNLQQQVPHKMGKIKNKEKKKKKKKKRPPHKSKMITGYIIYASEIRKEIIKLHPDRDFGYISKIVGVEWKNLPQETKIAYEKRAQEQNAKSKAIAAEALELKKLADAADERAKEQTASQSFNSMPSNCNGYASNGHSYANNHHLGPELSQSPFSSDSQGPVQQMQLQQTQYHMQQSTPLSKNGAIQQPLQIIQQQQQTIATTVQYCNNNSNKNQTLQANYSTVSQSQTPSQQQYQRNNIVYRKPATVKLRPKDGSTQTEPIRWVANEPKKPLRFSQKFIDYLNSNHHRL